tara:strand:- start:687 stop:869 length:183 start_codon:yes stop_codon:yes gene_type:complete
MIEKDDKGAYYDTAQMNKLKQDIRQLLLPKKQQGRNEKCNCGSGLKHKKCCWNKDKHNGR